MIMSKNIKMFFMLQMIVKIYTQNNQLEVSNNQKKIKNIKSIRKQIVIMSHLMQSPF